MTKMYKSSVKIPYLHNNPDPTADKSDFWGETVLPKAIIHEMN